MDKRIRTDILQADKNALIALATFSDYAPRNEAYSVSAAEAAKKAMEATQEKLVRLKAEMAATLDEAATRETTFHNIILGSKNESVAQYGENSDEVQALGLKKKNERKRPTRRKATPPTP